ncbi:hypothetical protein SEA_PEPE25_55 [Microbacterium phage Pepe25]|nr:hypothetical protein SEA_PEPE25_55 [Microbacterium phage Pepe25]
MNAVVRKARKKPVEIEFMVWPGGAENATPVIDWVLAGGGTASWMGEYICDEGYATEHTMPEELSIRTLEGVMAASPGDVIIRGVAGEFYPCKPGIFRDTYDIITEED